MYAISNQQRDEIIKLLTTIHSLSGNDTRTVNTKRKASIMMKKLSKAKNINHQYCTNINRQGELIHTKKA